MDRESANEKDEKPARDREIFGNKKKAMVNSRENGQREHQRERDERKEEHQRERDER